MGINPQENKRKREEIKIVDKIYSHFGRWGGDGFVITTRKNNLVNNLVKS